MRGNHWDNLRVPYFWTDPMPADFALHGRSFTKLQPTFSVPYSVCMLHKCICICIEREI